MNTCICGHHYNDHCDFSQTDTYDCAVDGCDCKGFQEMITDGSYCTFSPLSLVTRPKLERFTQRYGNDAIEIVYINPSSIASIEPPSSGGWYNVLVNNKEYELQLTKEQITTLIGDEQ